MFTVMALTDKTIDLAIKLQMFKANLKGEAQD